MMAVHRGEQPIYPPDKLYVHRPATMLQYLYSQCFCKSAVDCSCRHMRQLSTGVKEVDTLISSDSKVSTS